MKKNLAYLFSILFGCVAGFGLFLFVLSVDNTNPLNDKLLGKWKVVGSFNQGNFEYNEDEFILFTEQHVTYCIEDVCKEDRYKLSANEIELLNHKYQIDSKIDEYLKFYEGKDSYRILLRWDDNYLFDEEVDLEGKWNVLYKDTYVNNMQLEFKEGTLIQTVDGTTNTYQYELNQYHISVNDGQLNFVYIPLNEKEIIFVDTTYGTVWGLNK